MTSSPESTAAFAVQSFKLYAILMGICHPVYHLRVPRHLSELRGYPAAYSFTTCALTPLAGKLTTVFSFRCWVYIVFFAIFLVGSIICGWAPNSDTFIVGRAIAGIGANPKARPRK
ncbi:hypothetical protein F4818DRAFT_453266 [Hypoxylon cercidicola]|nr:hypothetical protein F4818DRAFT_453266 [Hypoxylon cercidicola]